MTKRGWRPKKPSPTDWDRIKDNAAKFAARVQAVIDAVPRHGPWTPANHTQNALYRAHAAAVRPKRRKPTAQRQTSYAAIPVDQEPKGPMTHAYKPSPQQVKRARRWQRANPNGGTPPNHIATAIKNGKL